MKVIICGAGQVGSNIASSLVREGNDVTIIDGNPQLIAEINDELDAKGIVGHASSPDSLKAAGAQDTDLLIGVTSSDEVNMMACQIGHSLFGIPRKIARIRQQFYLQPEWSNLFSRAHMPIDVIISPEVSVAEHIYQRLGIPGTTYVATLGGDKQTYLIGLICKDNAPVIKTPLSQIYDLFPNLSFRVLFIVRNDQAIIAPAPTTEILPGDECFILVGAGDLSRVMSGFGLEEQKARNLLIAGGGHIGFGLAKNLLTRSPGVQIKLIEHNEKRTLYLSEHLQKAVVLHGNVLDKETLVNAPIDNVETFVAVTNDDETNILGSILAKQYGCARAISLVNNSIYAPLVGSLGIDSVVSPGATVVASIMRHVRKGRVKNLHNLHDGYFEILEAEVSEASMMVNKTISELELPEDIHIAALIKDGALVFPDDDYLIKADDHVVVVNTREKAHAVERLFSMPVDLF